jgi:hypothetical protein
MQILTVLAGNSIDITAIKTGFRGGLEIPSYQSIIINAFGGFVNREKITACITFRCVINRCITVITRIACNIFTIDILTNLTSYRRYRSTSRA